MNTMNTQTTVDFIAARRSQRRHDAKLLVINPKTASIQHEYVDDLHRHVQPGDVFVINDAATIPASLAGWHAASGREVEIRLAANLSPDEHGRQWLAVVFGEGDWRTPTEDRPAPPSLHVGDRIAIGESLQLRVERVCAAGGRLVEIAFVDIPASWPYLFALGRPIQYSHLAESLTAGDQQTLFSGPPMAVEPPSSAFQLTWSHVLQLQDRGVHVVPISHAAGLSTTGDVDLDRALPFPERSLVSEATAAVINAAKAKGKQVMALGTSVTRALESAALPGQNRVAAGSFVSRLRLSQDVPRRIVDALVTGLHEDGSSHLDLLASFAEPKLIRAAYREAVDRGYLGHEYGDICVIAA